MQITEKAKGGGKVTFPVPVSLATPTVTVNGSPATISSSKGGEVTLSVAPAAGDTLVFTFEPSRQGKNYLLSRATLNQASGNVDFTVPFLDCTCHQIAVDTNGVISAGTVALWGLPYGKSTYEQVFNTDATPVAISFTLTAATKKALFFGQYTSLRLIPTGITGAGTYSAGIAGWSEGNAQ